MTTLRTRAAALLLIALATAYCSNSSPYVPDMTAHTIVSRHADKAFDVLLDRTADRVPLLRFLTETEDAKGREDLTRAWVAITELNAKGGDLLEKHVFSKATRDGDWKRDWPVGEQEAAFVSGTRDAVEEFVKGGE